MKKKDFTPIVCYSILFPQIVARFYPNYQPTATFSDWEKCFPALRLSEWVKELVSQTDNIHYSELDEAVSRYIAR